MAGGLYSVQKQHVAPQIFQVAALKAMWKEGSRAAALKQIEAYQLLKLSLAESLC